MAGACLGRTPVPACHGADGSAWGVREGWGHGRIVGARTRWRPTSAHSAGAPAGLRIPVQGQKEVLWCCLVLDLVPVRVLRGSGRVLIARTGANRGAAGPDLPVSGHWPGPVLARLTAGPELVADLHRRPGPVLARPNTPWGGWRAALSPGPGPARGHHHDPCAPHHLATWSGTRPGVRRGEYAGPWSQRVACLASGGGYTRRLCTAPVVAGGQFCRNLRIRADPTLFSSLCAQCPRRSGTWTSTRARVALVLILRLRHAHKTGPADRRQTTQDTA